MDEPFSIAIKHDENSQKLIVSGELIINHANIIKKEMIELLDYSKNLNIKVTNPSSIDITFIQIVIAIKRTFVKNKLNFDVEGTFSEEVFNLVTNAGFKDLFKL